MTRLAALALVGWFCTAMLAYAATVAVRDDARNEIALAAPAKRIVSLAPNATELLFAAGAGDRVVATVFGSDWPPSARSLRRVGDAFGLDLEAIVALQPDLVVTWPYTSPGQVQLLRSRGLPVFVVDPQDIAGIASTLERIGQLAGTAGEARAAAQSLRARYDALRARYAQRAPVPVFYEIWDAPLQTVGGTHIVSRAIETCGGRNVFASLPQPAPGVSVEAVIAARPEAIVAGGEGGRAPAWLAYWKQWPSVPAVAAGNLAVVDADYLHRPGPRFIDGVEELCMVLDRARKASAALHR